MICWFARQSSWQSNDNIELLLAAVHIWFVTHVRVRHVSCLMLYQPWLLRLHQQLQAYFYKVHKWAVCGNVVSSTTVNKCTRKHPTWMPLDLCVISSMGERCLHDDLIRQTSFSGERISLRVSRISNGCILQVISLQGDVLFWVHMQTWLFIEPCIEKMPTEMCFDDPNIKNKRTFLELRASRLMLNEVFFLWSKEV